MRSTGVLILIGAALPGLCAAPGSADVQLPTDDYLLSQGYALGASKFEHVVGWATEHGLRDQIKLLDWFEHTIGKQGRAISAGGAGGAMTATVLAERNPRRLVGVMTLCGVTRYGVVIEPYETTTPVFEPHEDGWPQRPF